MYIGGTVVPIDPQLDSERQDWMLKFAHTNVVVKNNEIIFSEVDREYIKNILEKSSELEHNKNTNSIAEKVKLMLFTSGTSGEKKCVELTDVAILSNCKAAYTAISTTYFVKTSKVYFFPRKTKRV